MTSRVLITGVGIVSPLDIGRDSTWTKLLAGESGIDRISSFDPDGFLTTFAGEVNAFDPQVYVGRKQARRMDRFVQFAVAAAMEAHEQSGLVINSDNCDRVSVMVASGIGGVITLSEQIEVLQDRGPARVNPFLIPMMLPDMASGQLSMLLGAKAASYSTVSACASGADSIGVAFEAIRRGEIDAAFAGGAEAAICPIGLSGFNACQALSRRNDNPKRASRPFDADRDGFVLGEGAAVLVMESFESAVSRGAIPIAELIGYGATADAHHITQPAPLGEGGAKAMRLAIAKAGISSEEVDYINAHGTSTPMNDKFETMAIKAVFGEYAYSIPISSTKSMTGHLLGASGALEAALTIMAIWESVVPPTINLENPDPDCNLDYTPLIPRPKEINIAMTNSFGFGGHNASLVFQKAR